MQVFRWGRWLLDLLHDVEGGWLAKKYFFLEEGGRRYFFRQGQKGTSAHASYQINIAD